MWLWHGYGDVWISSLKRSGAHEGGLHFVVAAADEGFWLATLKDPFPAHFCRPFCFLLIRIGTLPPYTPPLHITNLQLIFLCCFCFPPFLWLFAHAGKFNLVFYALAKDFQIDFDPTMQMS